MLLELVRGGIGRNMARSEGQCRNFRFWCCLNCRDRSFWKVDIAVCGKTAPNRGICRLWAVLLNERLPTIGNNIGKAAMDILPTRYLSISRMAGW